MRGYTRVIHDGIATLRRFICMQKGAMTGSESYAPGFAPQEGNIVAAAKGATRIAGAAREMDGGRSWLGLVG